MRGFFSLSGTELVEKGGFWAYGLLLGALCILGVLALLVIPALRVVVGGGIIFVAPREFAGQHKKLAVAIVVGSLVFMVSSCICWLQWDGPVSLAMMHVWFTGFKGHPGEIAGKSKVRLFFLLLGLLRFFC